MLTPSSIYSRFSSVSVVQASIPKFISGAYLDNTEEQIAAVFECQNVRITPSIMMFENAFEGKNYNQKVTIQNVGKNAAFIRICPPSSYAFHIKPLVRGQMLCPGLSITRNISYTYMRATAIPLAIVPIQINQEQVDYKLIVSLSKVSISAIPQQIDFGTLDARHTAAVRMLSLHNDGNKGTRFAIDLGRNEIELIVEPCKGIIQPHETITFRVECLGYVEGEFVREFWIKCETPLRIKVTGNIIDPQLQSYHPNITEDFTLVEFPKTYYGTSSSKTLVVKNRSATPAEYCTLAELPTETMDIQEASVTKPAYLQFKISPLEGTLHPYESRIFNFTYIPTKANTKKQGEHESNPCCCIQIIRVPCMNLSQIQTSENIGNEDKERPSTIPDDTISEISVLSLDDDMSLPRSAIETYALSHDTIQSKKNVRVILFGKAEEVSVSARPTSLDLGQIPINTTQTREILLTNNSFHLPIIVRYKKVCFIKVEPQKVTLPVFGKVEVAVSVTPAKIGKGVTKVPFDLLFYNQPKEDGEDVVIGYIEVPVTFEVPTVTPALQLRTKFNTGITPEYVKEVGFLTDDVRFNTPLKMPRATQMTEIKKKLRKSDDDLVAFPNDRPKTTRPWKSPVQCRTICAGIPRTVNARRDSVYELTKSESLLKRNQNSYWRKYVRKEGQRLKDIRCISVLSFPDYDISDKRLLLFNDAPKPQCEMVKGVEVNAPSWFIPLPPMQLNKVKIGPRNIRLNRMAPNTSSTTSVTLSNQNPFYILISAKPRKPVITFPEGSRRTLKPFSKATIDLTYHASTIIGRYNVITDFIVNASITFPVSIIVDVVSRCVKFSYDEITFDIDVKSSKYLDVYNPVNIPISFHWYVPDSAYTIEPSSATVPAHRIITCLMSYKPRNDRIATTTEIGVYSENGRRQMVTVSANVNIPLVNLEPANLDFNNIPLNLPVHNGTVLQNLGSGPVIFMVLNPNPMMGVSIAPLEGIIRGCGEQIFDIQVQISACISFSCTIEIAVQQTQILKLELFGSVVYPKVTVKPELLQLQKIVPNAFVKHVFVLQNQSIAPTTIEFVMQDYPEYTILESNALDDTLSPVSNITLAADEQKELYVHFSPIGASSYCFYLPFIINGILGPTFLHQPESIKPSFFVERNEANYTHAAIKGSLIPLPHKLPSLVIRSAAGGDTVRFSKLSLNFKYFPHPDFKSDTHIELKIWNGAKDTCKFCIRTDNLSRPFSLEYLTGNEITTLEHSIVCVLAPDEYVIFKAEFCPRNPGDYHIQLPIYVRHYLQGKVFNYLKFNGWYPKPTICAVQKNVCFEPVPLRCETIYNFLLKAEFHPKPCKILARTETTELEVKVMEPIPTKNQKFMKDISVVFKYSTKAAGSLNTTVSFFCDCGANCDVPIKGSTDNCTITTHGFMQTFTKKLLNQQSLESVRSSFENLNIKASTIDTDYIDTLTASTIFSADDVFESLTNTNDSTFPLFPADHDSSEYARHMRSSLRTMEEWLFHQGFFGRKYNKIPEGMAFSPKRVEPEKNINETQKKKKKKPQKTAQIKLVELLSNLVGSQINNCLHIRDIPADNLERINYMYNIYIDAQNFIVSLGGVLPHVYPEHLLTYNDYVTFLKSIYSFRPEFAYQLVPEPLSATQFYLISKQSWLDLLLQTYKVLVLYRVRYPDDFFDRSINSVNRYNRKSINSASCTNTITSRGYSSCIIKSANSVKIISENDMVKKLPNFQNASKVMASAESGLSYGTIEDAVFWQHLLQVEPHNTNIYSESEVILLSWLEHHFNNQREELWKLRNLRHGNTTPLPRAVKSFKFDLNDGLVLIALTSSYCPYLRPYLLDIYTNPTCIEQAYHNVSKLLQTWDMINLSFKLTSKSIVYPNSLQMLMLVTYLYEALPYFYPNNKMHLKADLSLTNSKGISVENMSNSTVVFKVMFFGNNRGFFSVSENPVSLHPYEAKNLVVSFNGKKICFEHATMILNGETYGQCYAKSIAFDLTGESVPSYCTSIITVPAPYYEIIELNLIIQSPYKGAASYEINFSLLEPNDVRTCKILPWALPRKSKLPKRMVTTNITLDVDEDGSGVFHIFMGCITTNPKSYWLIYTNAELGDFTVKIVSIPQTTDRMYKTITVLLPEGFDKRRCHCKGDGKFLVNRHCPRTVLINVPCTNDMLWHVVAEQTIKLVNPGDVAFWRNYLGTVAGMHLYRWMTDCKEYKNEIFYDIENIYHDTVTYAITCESETRQISLPLKQTIDNVFSWQDHEIPVHINSAATEPFDFKFKMAAQHGYEYRFYSVEFHKVGQSDNEIPVNV